MSLFSCAGRSTDIVTVVHKGVVDTGVSSPSDSISFPGCSDSPLIWFRVVIKGVAMQVNEMFAQNTASL